MTDHQIPLGDAVLDLRQRSVFFRDTRIPLTTNEFLLIRRLASQFRSAVSRDEISMCLYGAEWDGLNRAVDVNVARRRRKLRQLTVNYLDIRSVRNIGYYLIEDPCCIQGMRKLHAVTG